ncbi:MAG: DUF423 domain-containing protein [Oceanococcus sp.]
MDRFMLGLASFYGFTAVAIGAFAAHALKKRLDQYALDIIQTATQYQMIHALAMLVVIALAQTGGLQLRLPLWLFAIGIPLFSGSLYAVAISGIKPIGAITPVGGILLLAAWLALLSRAVKLTA